MYLTLPISYKEFVAKGGQLVLRFVEDRGAEGKYEHRFSWCAGGKRPQTDGLEEFFELVDKHPKNGSNGLTYAELESGAFSLNMTDTKIPLDELMAFAEKHPKCYVGHGTDGKAVFKMMSIEEKEAELRKMGYRK